MHKLRISRLAQSDLEDIQNRGLAEFGVAATRAYMNGFDDIFLRLHAYPLIGRTHPEYGQAIRSCLHAPYHVLYRYEADLVAILRVLHAARKPVSLDDLAP